MFGNYIDGFLKKTWSKEDIQKYVGVYKSAHLTHSADARVQEKAASGGTTSTLLIEGLSQNLFDGAVVCATKIEDGKVRARFSIATTADDILAARGSKYVETKFLREVIPLIKEFKGRVAVVGLPCDITALKNRTNKDAQLSEKIVLTIALVCGHNSRTDLIDRTTARLEKKQKAKLTDYRFRVGHWRGNLEADFDDGSTVSLPTKTFNDYQNLFFFCERKCLACYDHYGYNADISIGDIWLFRLKDDPIKRSAIIVRTDKGNEAFKACTYAGAVISDPLNIRDIMDGQSRIGPSHYNVTARFKVSKLFGVKLKDPVKDSVSWHARLNAFLLMLNMRLSESRLGRWLIFAVPRPIWKAYLYFKKGLESL